MKSSKDSIVSGIGLNLGFGVATRRRVGFVTKGDSLTKQSDKDACDINNIVNQFANGVIPVQNSLEPQYGDSPTLDLKESLDMVFMARNEFESLSRDEKALFGNDENVYFNFLDDPDGYSSEFVERFSPQSAENSSDESSSTEPSETGE